MSVLDKGVRIVSDGTRGGTFIMDIATGEFLTRVQGISFRIDPRQMTSTVELVLAVPFEYEGPAEVVKPKRMEA